eukprot:COSAG01_NODE_3486_length_6017_cov_8.866509_2_plen_94_part_00
MVAQLLQETRTEKQQAKEQRGIAARAAVAGMALPSHMQQQERRRGGDGSRGGGSSSHSGGSPIFSAPSSVVSTESTFVTPSPTVSVASSVRVM